MTLCWFYILNLLDQIARYRHFKVLPTTFDTISLNIQNHKITKLIRLSINVLSIYPFLKMHKITRLGQLGANISPDRSSLTPQVLIGNFLKHNYPLLYELQHINLLCLYLPKEDGVSPDAEYITQIIFSIFLQ